MSRSPSQRSAKSWKSLFIATAASLLPACATPTPPSPVQPHPSPLVLASCPKSLGSLPDMSMGTLLLKLIEVAGTYHECRAAAMERQK